jgi:hypothetical protein
VKKTGLLDDVFIGIKLGMQKNMEQFKIIFDCIELLKRKQMIHENGRLLLSTDNKPNYTKSNKVLEMPVMARTISDVERLSDESLIRSVIEYV